MVDRWEASRSEAALRTLQLSAPLRSGAAAGAGSGSVAVPTLTVPAAAAIAVQWLPGALADPADGPDAVADAASAAAPFELAPGVSASSAVRRARAHMWRQQRAAALLSEMSASGAGLVRSALLLE